MLSECPPNLLLFSWEKENNINTAISPRKCAISRLDG